MQHNQRLYVIIVLTIIVIVAFIFYLFQSNNVTESFATAIFAWMIETSIILDVNYIGTKKKRLKLLEKLDKELEDDLKEQEKYED